MSAFEIWTAGVMLAGMCARFGRAGRFPHLGEFLFFFFTTFIYPWGCFFLFLFVVESRWEWFFWFWADLWNLLGGVGKNGRLWVLLDDGRVGGLEGVGGGDGDGSVKES